MEISKRELDHLTYKVIGCAIEVHKQLGPGLLESIYEKCMIKELALQGFDVKSQINVPLIYKGEKLELDLRLDLLVENILIVEIKAVNQLLPVYEAQLLSYMKLLEKPKGILLNFCCQNIFREGQRTFVNSHYSILPD